MPADIYDRLNQLNSWNVPVDTYTYILKNNLVPLIENIEAELDVPCRFTATLLAHTLKNIQGKFKYTHGFSYQMLFDLLSWLKYRNIDLAISRKMLYHLYQHPKMDYESILVTLGFKEIDEKEITAKLPFLIRKYSEIRTSKDDKAGHRWIMGNLSRSALGNISLARLSGMIKF
jgi:glutamyl-tRNA(Gln) amidotransferase subunit E